MSSAISTKERVQNAEPQRVSHNVQRERVTEAKASAHGTPRREEFQPWQFFILAALAGATVVVLLSRGSSPANLVFISVAALTTAIVGIGVYRTLLPLVAPDMVDGPAMIGGRTRAALEREKSLVLRAIKDLEFDRAMGKVSEDDFADMAARLRARAARLIQSLDAEGSGYQTLIEREIIARLAKSGPTNHLTGPAVGAELARSATELARPDATLDRRDAAPTCASCGTENDADAKFCKACGTKL